MLARVQHGSNVLAVATTGPECRIWFDRGMVFVSRLIERKWETISIPINGGDFLRAEYEAMASQGKPPEAPPVPERPTAPRAEVNINHGTGLPPQWRAGFLITHGEAVTAVAVEGIGDFPVKREEEGTVWRAITSPPRGGKFYTFLLEALRASFPGLTEEMAAPAMERILEAVRYGGIDRHSESYRAGHGDGIEDVALMLRKAVDPEDLHHLSLEGTLGQVSAVFGRIRTVLKDHTRMDPTSAPVDVLERLLFTALEVQGSIPPGQEPPGPGQTVEKPQIAPAEPSRIQDVRGLPWAVRIDKNVIEKLLSIGWTEAHDETEGLEGAVVFKHSSGREVKVSKKTIEKATNLPELLGKLLEAGSEGAARARSKK
jgi:hypothetical protein